MSTENSQKKIEIYSFRAPSDYQEKIHRVADYYGKQHFSFSEKCVFLIDKMDEITFVSADLTPAKLVPRHVSTCSERLDGKIEEAIDK